MSNGVEPRYLWLCIQLQTPQFECIRCDELHDDQDFYATLKSTYDGTRGYLRCWLSPWQYDHCKFYRFYKYDVNRGIPLELSFPTHETLYDFEPRQPRLAFPHGPIPAQQFNDRYYSRGDAYHFSRIFRLSTTQNSRSRSRIRSRDKRSLNALPKRTQVIEMEDGKCEIFCGLLAVERRCHYCIALHLILLNLVWLVFAPLWILVWDIHPICRTLSHHYKLLCLCNRLSRAGMEELDRCCRVRITGAQLHTPRAVYSHQQCGIAAPEIRRSNESIRMIVSSQIVSLRSLVCQWVDQCVTSFQTSCTLADR
jgi:hypothetical protein